MICVLLNRDDVQGVKLSRLLRHAAKQDIKLIAAEELVYATSFNCGFKNGKAFFLLQLIDGFIFSNETVTAVINRIQHLPVQHLARFKKEDQDYVKAELDAVFVFLFSILPNNIFNSATPAGFCGRRRPQLEWLLLAHQCGFNVQEVFYKNKALQPTGFTNEQQLQSILFFRGKCYGVAAVNFPQVAVCCTKLGQLAGENILEIYFWQAHDKIFFSSASTQPLFENIDADFINAVNSFL
jgi:hypothetical protein